MNPLLYRRTLRKFQRRRAKTLAAYREDRAKAEKEKKPRDDIEAIIASERHEIEMIDDEIESLESRNLIEAAQALLLPLPEYSKDSSEWEQSGFTGRYRLSLAAMVKLRAQIRKERKERREGAIAWITAITGLIGVLIGLLSVYGTEK